MLLGFFWPGWWLWAVLIFFLGRFYAEPLDQITPLNPGRRAWLGWVCCIYSGLYPGVLYCCRLIYMKNP